MLIFPDLDSLVEVLRNQPGDLGCPRNKILYRETGKTSTSFTHLYLPRLSAACRFRYPSHGGISPKTPPTKPNSPPLPAPPTAIRPQSQPLPSLPIALPPRILPLQIREKSQTLHPRKRLNRQQIPNIPPLQDDVRRQHIDILRRISLFPLAPRRVNRLERHTPHRSTSP